MDTPPDPVDYWLQKAGLDPSVASRMMEAIRALPGPCAETLMHLSPYVVLPRRDVRDPNRPFVVPEGDRVMVSLEGPPVCAGRLPLRFRTVYDGPPRLPHFVSGYALELKDRAYEYRVWAKSLRKPERVAEAAAVLADLDKALAGLTGILQRLLDGEF